MGDLRRKLGFGVLLAGLVMPLGQMVANAQDPQTEQPTALEAGFDNPPHETKPGTLYHFMSGNITREGIALDLDAIEQVGIGKMLLFEVSQGIAHGPIKFRSPEHIEMVGYLAAEAKRRNINLGVHNADGWTASGGPWITADESMKRVVWSEHVSAGGAIDMQLAMPRLKADYFRDIATIAFPSQPGDAQNLTFNPTFTATGGRFDPALLTDDDLETDSMVHPVDGKAVLTIDLQEVRQVGHLDMITRWWNGQRYTLEWSADGEQWTDLPEPFGGRLGKQEHSVIASFAPIMARYLRLTGTTQFGVRNVNLAAEPRVADFYARSSYGDFRNRSNTLTLPETEKDRLGDATGLRPIDPASIIDLSAEVDENGRLTTRLPDGNWTIMRFGYTTTGAVNVPASPEGTGYEVDKFSKAAIEKHYENYIAQLVAEAREQEPGALNRTLIDSFEVGGQNWTQGYDDLFRQATGQEIVRYLPLYAGRMVSDIDESAAFYDTIRRINADLMHENYFGHFADLAHADGLEVYLEGYGFGPFNSLDAARKVDLPMPEFVLSHEGEDLTTGMVSAAHIYGRNEISAESFTSRPTLNWSFYPGMAKIKADEMWTKGINGFVFHRFVHQPNVHVKPGMTMNRWGAHFDRHQPWWDTAGKAWFEYMARGQFLLRQGIPVADVAYYVGDSAPNVCPATAVIREFMPAPYKFDCVNLDVLENRFTLEGGRIMRPDGNGYAVLVMGNSHVITAQTLTRIEQIAASGVPVFGARPQPLVAPGTSDADRAALQARINAIWAGANFHPLEDFAPVLASKQGPRFISENGPALEFMHRRTDEGEIFFTYNPTGAARDFEISVYGEGKAPEIWDAQSGERKMVAKYRFANGRTYFTLPLEEKQSAFVVLGDFVAEAPVAASAAIVAENWSMPLTIPEKWSVILDEEATDLSFALERMAPMDLKDHPDQRARDFAGIARYINHFDVSEGDLARATEALLDMGDVAISATVFVNGAEVGTSWVAPHRLDILSALKPGANRIEIRVATLWINQLIADAALPDTTGFVPESQSYGVTNQMIDWFAENRAPPPGPRKTFATQNFFDANSPRVPAGLIGPVSLTLREQAAP